jgi:hypothetical protein
MSATIRDPDIRIDKSSTVNDLVLAGRARVKVLCTKDSWFGVTHREDHKPVVERECCLIRDGHYFTRS